jgi:hypothetical protein
MGIDIFIFIFGLTLFPSQIERDGAALLFTNDITNTLTFYFHSSTFRHAGTVRGWPPPLEEVGRRPLFTDIFI